MEMTYLHTFRAVVKWGSYTRAAEELGYAQSSVTAQMQKLEEAYGAVLFERFGRSMRLTIAGETLLPYADQIVKLFAESKESVSGKPSGTMTIGTANTLAAYFLPPYLQAYKRAYPDINITLNPEEPSIAESIRNGDLDFGFLFDVPGDDPEIERLLLREELLSIVTPPGHRLAGREYVTAADLDKETLILTEENCTYRNMLLNAMKAQGISYRIAYEFANMEAIKQCVAYGLGIALMPYIAVADEAARGQVSAVRFTPPGRPFYTQLIYAKKKWLPKAFTDFIGLFERQG